MAKLKKLLKEEEIASIKKNALIDNEILEEEYKFLNIDDLGWIGLELLQSESEIAPECILPAKAIEILVGRAKKMDIALR
jgi:hypothetical protein